MNLACNRIQRVVRLLVVLLLAVVGILNWESIRGEYKGYRLVILIAFLVCLLIASALLALWPDKRTPEQLEKRPSLTSILFALICPVYGQLTAELVTSVSVKGSPSMFQSLFGPTFTTRYFWLNLLFICILILFFTALTGSLKMGPLLGALGISLFSIVNYYVFTFRGSAITAPDIVAATTAAGVLTQYTITLNFRVYTAFVMMCFLWMVAFRIKRHFRLLPKHPFFYLGWLGSGLAVFALCVNFFVLGPFLYDQHIKVSFWSTMKKSYRGIGTALTITSTIRQAFPQVPEGYSAQAASELAEPYIEARATQKEEAPSEVLVSEQTPNLILVVDESFKDMQKLGNFQVNEPDYLSFIRSLEEQFPTGTVYCPGYGGRTANTEFELLTGMSTTFLPQDCTPFVTYVKHQTPSLADILRGKGYAGIIGMHPYRGSSYNRNKAYPYLGLTPVFIHDMPIKAKKIRNLTSDESDFENIIYFYEEERKASQKPFFFYTMTMQNHSDYADPSLESTVKTQNLKKSYSKTNQYLTLCEITDQALEGLVNYFEKTGEPTVIFFMGDHQPKLNSGFYKEIQKDMEYPSEYAKEYALYNVNFYLWSNFELAKTEVDLSQTSMNYMQLNLLRFLGFDLTPFQQFQAELQEKVPILGRFAYVGADGEIYQYEDLTSPYYEDIRQYYVLCYNNLFDSENRVEDFFL